MVDFQYNPNIDFNKFIISKSDIEDILPQWKTKINEVYEYKNNNLIELNISIAANSETEIQQWIDDYEEKSKCSYSIRSTEKCTGARVQFKRRLICQHNTRNNKPTNHKNPKNSNCPSTIAITLRSVNNKYKGKDKSKAPDPRMPCEIKILPYHNHSSADALPFRQVNRETRDKLVKLFESGYSPVNALKSLKSDIQREHDNFNDLLADRSTCPDYRYCYHLYTKVLKKKHRTTVASPDIMERKVNEFSKEDDKKSAMECCTENIKICWEPSNDISEAAEEQCISNGRDNINGTSEIEYKENIEISTEQSSEILEEVYENQYISEESETINGTSEIDYKGNIEISTEQHSDILEEVDEKQYIIISEGSGTMNGMSEIVYTDDIEMSRVPSTNISEEFDEEQYISKGIDTINDMTEIFFEYLKRSPLEMCNSLQVFCNGLKSIKTLSGFATACQTFSSGIMNQKKNRKYKIPVQPTAISRRKTNISEKRSGAWRYPQNSSTLTTVRRRIPIFPKKRVMDYMHQ